MLFSDYLKHIQTNMGKLRGAVTSLKKMYSICSAADANFFFLLLRTIRYKLFYNRDIIAHKRVIIKGVKNIHGGNTLTIGLGRSRFVHNGDVTYLNIAGSLTFEGNHTIGRGCRIDVAEGATVTIGAGGYLNVKTTIIISNKLQIGKGCVISWNCQFLDDDFHQLNYEGRVEKNSEIILGNNIWVGCGVEFYKGTVIADGCVIAAGSIVRSVISEPNCLVAGNPAKIIKRNVTWK